MVADGPSGRVGSAAGPEPDVGRRCSTGTPQTYPCWPRLSLRTSPDWLIGAQAGAEAPPRTAPGPGSLGAHAARRRPPGSPAGPAPVGGCGDRRIPRLPAGADV